MTNQTKPTTPDLDGTSADRPIDFPADDDGSSPLGDVTRRAREAANAVAGTASVVTARFPEAASEIDRMVRSGSEDTLRTLAVGSVGLALGLLIGGANRLLVLAALLPAGVMGLALSNRRTA
jgi:hypothetical protein